MKNKERLEACDFCGSRSAGLRSDFALNVRVWYLVCDGCAAKGPPGSNETEAVEHWNTRTPAPGVGEGVELAKRAIRAMRLVYDAHGESVAVRACDKAIQIIDDSIHTPTDGGEDE